MFWIEESVHLNETYTKVLKNSLFRVLTIVSVVKWLSMVVGAVGCAGMAFLQYRKVNDTITTVSPVTKTPPVSPAISQKDNQQQHVAVLVPGIPSSAGQDYAKQ